MKKSLFCLLFFGATLIAGAQDSLPVNQEGKIVYEEVVAIEGATKDQLFKQARSWFKTTYKQADQDEDVLYLNDSYLGELGANPYMWMEVSGIGNNTSAGAILYDFRVEVKEGRFRYKISNLYHEAQRSRLGSGGALENKAPDCGTLNMQQKYWDEIKIKAHENFKKIVASLKEHMAKSPEAGAEDNDW